jgi:hypothetical protein
VVAWESFRVTVSIYLSKCKHTTVEQSRSRRANTGRHDILLDTRVSSKRTRAPHVQSLVEQAAHIHCRPRLLSGATCHEPCTRSIRRRDDHVAAVVVSAPPVEAEDPEVTACKQQCARQRQFGAEEWRGTVRRLRAATSAGAPS